MDQQKKTDSPAGRIDLGRTPALGRRARLLTGLTTASLAAAALITAANAPQSSHSGPFTVF